MRCCRRWWRRSSWRRAASSVGSRVCGRRVPPRRRVRWQADGTWRRWLRADGSSWPCRSLKENVDRVRGSRRVRTAPHARLAAHAALLPRPPGAVAPRRPRRSAASGGAGNQRRAAGACCTAGGSSSSWCSPSRQESAPVYLLPLYPAIALLGARALARRVASRAGWTRLGAAVGAMATIMLAAAFVGARHDAARHGVLQFARDVRTLVPPDAALHASLGLSEDDVLVLAYLLERPLLRRRLTCDAHDAASASVYYLRPIASGGIARVIRVTAMRSVELVRCDKIA